ncbi:MAG: hypothetical protein LBJ96_02780, partial [Holosporaceae bacterium]|nr:hypothetical protein [Holosporaceae bacterium]
FAFSVINFIGMAVASFVCKSVKPINFSLKSKFNFGISDNLKKKCIFLIKNTDTRLYQKCYLFIAKKSG